MMQLRRRGSTVEQLICNQWVAGSIPVAGSITGKVIEMLSVAFFTLQDATNGILSQ